jgi:hypothetical protein
VRPIRHRVARLAAIAALSAALLAAYVTPVFADGGGLFDPNSVDDGGIIGPGTSVPFAPQSVDDGGVIGPFFTS